ncbi:hypothetical protein [Thioclava marina]|nr:hypothetical protein [Thioclava marina]
MKRETVTYSELGTKLGKTGAMPGRGLGSDFYNCQEWLKEKSLPPLTFLVLKKQSGRPSDEGRYNGRKFGDMNDEEIQVMQESCFSYEWSSKVLKALGIEGPSPED